MALSARTFQTAANYKGEMSAAAYAAMNTAGWWTNKTHAGRSNVRVR